MAIAAIVAAGALVRRQFCLWNLPDVGDPFNVAAFTAPGIPESQNAFTYFRQAVEQFESYEGRVKSSEFPRLRRSGWTSPGPELSEWINRNRRAFALWKLGTEQSGAAPNGATPFEYQKLSPFTFLALIEAARLRSSGDMDGAWEVYRAILRMVRHTQRRATIYARLNGLGALALFRENVNTWARDPRVSQATLRQALGEVISAEAACPTNAETLKAEYIVLIAHLNDHDYLKRRILTGEGITVWRDSGQHFVASWYRNLPWYEEVRDYLNREPERSRRVARLVYMNWIAHVDGIQPFHSRMTRQYPDLFMNDPPNASLAMVYPSGLHDWLSTTRMWELGYGGYNGADWRKKERKILSEVIVALARELYTREHGEPPESNEALVGRYLERLPEEAIPSGETPATR